MDSERERIERARAKNLAYIQQQDEREASQAADELLASVLGSPAASGSSAKRSTPASGGSKGNSSVYVTGLTTYMACRQLEGVCNKLGKVRRIKFYKDERGGLKGDAVVTYSSRATMLKAVDRLIRVSYLATQLNHFEVKPGVIITAMEATFSSKKPIGKEESKENAGAAQVGAQATKDLQTPSGVATATPPKIAAADEPPHLDLPSRSIILKHVWDPLEGSDAAFVDELEQDMRSECGKHGAVDHVQIVADGSAIVRFGGINAAIACLKVMNGRWFAGRQIEARFDQTTAEDPSDADTKVDAFLASLGE
ncbi:HIV Tat-specific factor 1 [Phytophthora pseudosyringae]|uniref:HIV Tat-specific factor 1 n=1 Tax=Phytophthora pseudosyringae TaxID=221518 RepID=A0A8T1VZ13_9STRA|nr:HIV Tat-specific factor 1 [Phytophthora pseudosyringae]